ncbi:MAG: SRPBCC family protein [Proteobacteria bacterium]|nr:SRPBCC family protein [Pseudomonadota bacterium]
MFWFLAVAVAAPPVQATTSTVIEAKPAAVKTVLSDLGNWPALWELKSAEDASRLHVRGEPQSLRQLLTWSSSETSRGRMNLDAIDEGSVAYTVDWASVGVTARAKPPSHTGVLTLAEEGEGTRVTWATETDKRSASRLERQLLGSIETLEALATQDAPPMRPPPELTAAPGVLAWQGYRHRWTYNHRINRSGDWWTVPSCTDETCTATQVHAAASGSGVDRATFDGFGATLTGDGVVGWYGSLSLWFDGREGEALTDRVCMAVPAEVGEGPALLRGYDLDAVESADSLWSFALEVSRSDGEVCADATIQMDCKTPECGSERLTTYSLEVPFVIATGPLAWSAHEATQAHSWKAKDIRDEPVPSALSRTLPIQEDRPALVGFSGFSIELDAALHTLGLDLAVRPGEPSGAGLPVELDLFYVQWGPVEIAPMTVAQFAHEGQATLTADLVVVQPEAGCVSTAQTAGTTFWPGKQADASVPLAEHQSEEVFARECAR